MLLRNETAFAALGFGQVHRDGPRMAVFCVRAAYVLGPEGELSLANAQDNVLSDVYEGDPHQTPLLRVGDLIPFKPFTDVTVLGAVHATDSKAGSSLNASITVGDYRDRVTLRISGPRMWLPTLRYLKPSWKLGPSEAAIRVPLDYRIASGGRFAGDPDNGCDPRNPIGPGILTKHSALGL